MHEKAETGPKCPDSYVTAQIWAEVQPGFTSSSFIMGCLIYKYTLMQRNLVHMLSSVNPTLYAGEKLLLKS